MGMALTRPGFILDVHDWGKFFADPCSQGSRMVKTLVQKWSKVKKNLTTYMCCDNIVVELFDVLSSRNILPI